MGVNRRVLLKTLKIISKKAKIPAPPNNPNVAEFQKSAK
jgi:hypothetical protein